MTLHQLAQKDVFFAENDSYKPIEAREQIF